MRVSQMHLEKGQKKNGQSGRLLEVPGVVVRIVFEAMSGYIHGSILTNNRYGSNESVGKHYT